MSSNDFDFFWKKNHGVFFRKFPETVDFWRKFFKDVLRKILLKAVIFNKIPSNVFWPEDMDFWKKFLRGLSH